MMYKNDITVLLLTLLKGCPVMDNIDYTSIDIDDIVSYAESLVLFGNVPSGLDYYNKMAVSKLLMDVYYDHVNYSSFEVVGVDLPENLDQDILDNDITEYWIELKDLINNEITITL